MIRFYQFLLLSVFLFFSIGLFGQNIPQSVQNNFANKYPGLEVLEWEFFDGKYTASFFSNDNYMVANFDNAGNWIQSTRQLKEEQLPKRVKKCWKKKYKDVQFVTAMLEVEKNNQKPRYHISFESSEDLVNLVYGKRGRIKDKASEPIQPD